MQLGVIFRVPAQHDLTKRQLVCLSSLAWMPGSNATNLVARRPAQDCASHLDDMLWVKRRWNGSQAYADTRYQDVLLAVAVARLFPGG